MTYYQKQVLIAVYYSNDRSLSAHNPADYIKKKMPTEFKREKKFSKKFSKALQFLKSKGLIIKHPGGRSTSFYLSKFGRDYAEKFVDEQFENYQ
ncbi:MAG: hypothetical protein GPJ54_12660 [Candidatus Heimdallarchaeota archaeon]|nr:hypothetical protein [Candidatus Heimdallarchaeota archaeon]